MWVCVCVCVLHAFLLSGAKFSHSHINIYEQQQLWNGWLNGRKKCNPVSSFQHLYLLLFVLLGKIRKTLLSIFAHKTNYVRQIYRYMLHTNTECCLHFTSFPRACVCVCVRLYVPQRPWRMSPIVVLFSIFTMLALTQRKRSTRQPYNNVVPPFSAALRFSFTSEHVISLYCSMLFLPWGRLRLPAMLHNLRTERKLRSIYLYRSLYSSVPFAETQTFSFPTRVCSSFAFCVALSNNWHRTWSSWGLRLRCTFPIESSATCFQFIFN